MRLIAVLFACLLVPSVAVAKPSRHGVNEFKGDRWDVAWGGMGADVLKAKRCAPPFGARECRMIRKRKVRRHERVETARRPVTVIVPLPRVRPDVAPPADVEAAAESAAWNRIVCQLHPERCKPKNIFVGFLEEIALAARPPKGRSLAGIVQPLAAKVMQIASACPGTVVISTVRPGAVVRGSGRPSLHRYGKAVDIGGNYRCIYIALKGFPGGVSTDAHRVHHVHISFDPKGREWGRRFSHWQPGKRRTRYARHRRQHYASAR